MLPNRFLSLYLHSLHHHYLGWMFVQSGDYLDSGPPNGRRYRQGRDLAEKATRCRIRRWGQNPESVGECPHLSDALGVRQFLTFIT
jgi:hypothetical protein